MIKSRRDTEIDTDKVKQYNEESKEWSGYCPVCNDIVTGTLSELRAHKCKHGK